MNKRILNFLLLFIVCSIMVLGVATLILINEPKQNDAVNQADAAWITAVTDDILRLSADTAAASTNVTTLSASSAQWESYISQDANFGIDVSDAGDVNGDGYDDVIVGADWYSNGQTNEGAAFLYYGSANGLSQTYDWMTESNEAQAELGYSVSSAGDVNNDGYDDLIIGAPGYSGTGGAFIFLGDAAGPATTADIILEGEQDDSKFGYSVSSAGYVNNDNFADVIVGSPEYNGNWGENEGRAYVYYGNSSGVDTTADWIAEIDQEFGSEDAKFGYSVDSAGDFDGNSFDDVVIGAPYYANDGMPGLIAVFPGSVSGLPNSGGIAKVDDGYNTTGSDGSLFGFSVSGAGDVDNNGIDDVIVGAPSDTTGSGPNNTAYLYLGATDRFTQTFGYDAQIPAPQTNALFGYDVDGAGDINNDGNDDLIIGAPQYDDSQSKNGAAFVYLGDAEPSWSTFDIDYIGEQVDSVFGTAVSAAGDVNGDSHDDFLVGAPKHDTEVSSVGQAFGYYGFGTITGVTAVNDSPGLVDEAINFDATITSGGYSSYSWDFGDSNSGSGASTSHEYSMPGIYTATVSVDNPFSPVVTATTVVSVTVDGLVTPGSGGQFGYTNSQGQGTGVEVPPGAVENNLSLSFTPLDKQNLTQPPPSGSGKTPINYYFDLEAGDPRRIFLPLVLKNNAGSALMQSQVVDVTGVSGETAVVACPVGHFCFLEPVTITITYNEELLNGVPESSLKLLFWDDEAGDWIDAATTCDPESQYNRNLDENYFTIDVCHFSRFGVVG